LYLYSVSFLTDRTNGRAYAAVLRPSIAAYRLCIVAKRRVLEQKTAYMGSRIWEIDWYQNEWPWTLFIGRLRWRSCQPLRHICLWIFRKPLEIKAWFQGTANETAYWESNGHVTDDVT